MRNYILISLILFSYSTYSRTLKVGTGLEFNKIQHAVNHSSKGDTIYVLKGLYKEQNLKITHPLVLIGIDYPVLDGEKKYEVVSIKSDSVTINGFTIQHSGFATLDDPGAIKSYNCNYIVIENNIFKDNFFGVYIQYGRNCIIKNNTIEAYGTEEQQIGNGIHCWKSDSLQIIGNKITGHRDGIYFEFVTNSIIWRNRSWKNIRYGLHFMFSNNDAYISNEFRNNGAGVAVMFTRNVKMFNNYFEENWGDASYGILLKEISDSYIAGNTFIRNTSAIYLEGASRILIEKNAFVHNGWGMKIQASCMDNVITKNKFVSNTFDISTNGSLVLSTFNGNYWDKYEGYDLDKNNIGDIPYHPISLFSMIAENNPQSMLLFRSFFVMLLDKSEKILPSLTPEGFKDDSPLMHQPF